MTRTDQPSEVRQAIYLIALPWGATLTATAFAVWWGISMVVGPPDYAALVGAIFTAPGAAMAWDNARMLRKLIVPCR